MGKDNKKRNRRKGKDLNTKGKVLQGSDMDAFIDEQRSKAEESQKTRPAAAANQTEAVPSQNESGEVKEEETSDAVLNALPTKCLPDTEGVVRRQATLETGKLSETDSLKTDDEKIGLQDGGATGTSSVSDLPAEEASPASGETSSEVDAVAAQKDDASATSVAETSSTKVPEKESVADATADEVQAFGTDSAKTDKASEKAAEASENAPSADNEDVAVDEVSSLKYVAGKSSSSSSSTEAETQPAPAKPLSAEIKYTYSEDQWSPLNPEGKKQYDRNFMLQLQFANHSIVKPVGLPLLPEIILNEPRVKNEVVRQASVDHSVHVDFTPGFIKQSIGVGPRGPPRRGGGGSGMKRPNEQPRKVISVNLDHNINLHTSENAWKPIITPKKESDLSTEDLYKKIRGILNKLTPQNFERLINQVNLLPINTEERLKGSIDILFEKAISEPNFSVAYANMAKCLNAKTVPLDSDPKQTVAFRKLLLNKCQQEFEKDKAEELDIEKLQGLIDAAESEEKRKQLTEEKNAAMYRAKRRSLGNIRFIGELFKLRMLTENIMHECLKKLLKSNNDEDNLECLCQLLTTIGQDLEKRGAQPPAAMNQYFSRLLQIVDMKKTSSRIRFMIQDVIELRKSSWVPRRQNNNPKTIEQIHKEAEKEAEEKQLALQRFSQEQRSNRRGPPGQGERRNVAPPVPASHIGDEGWTAVGKAPKSIVDPAKMRLTKQPMDDNIQLGPGGRGMSAWHRGSSGGGKTASQDDRPAPTPNRFSALGGFGSESMDAKTRSGQRGGGYSGRLSGPHRGPVSRPSQERASNESSYRASGDVRRRESALSPAGSRSASQEIRTAPSDYRVAPASQTAAAAASSAADEKEISEEEIEKKTKSLMEEYLHGHDIKEAALCVKELGSSKSLKLFVYHSLLQNLERSGPARHFTGMLHHHLVKTKQMMIGSYVEGLRDVLELADDMVIDIPRIWQYLGELIFPVVEDGSIPMTFLQSACEPLLACDKAGVVLAEVLNEAARKLGHHKAADLWHQSGLKWTDLVKADAVESFLKEQKLQFTEVSNASGGPGAGRLSAEQVHEHLIELLNDSSSSVERIIDYIDDTLDEATAKSAPFIRAFMSSLCKTCLKEQKAVAVNVEKFKKFLPVLNKYIGQDELMEVQALFALQAFVHKLEHPPGLLRGFFDILYDDEVISEAAFYKWKDSSEPSEAAGKGVALSSVVQFFHWLEENDDES